MTPTPAPDWRALVEAEGAKPLYMETLSDGGCNARFGAIEFTIAVRHGQCWHVNRGREYVDDPAACVRDAIATCCDDLRARIARDTAALARLGGGE